MHKREFVSVVFDNNLYYQNGIYRTPMMMDMFAHNSLLMKEKGYLIYEKKRDDLATIPFSGLEGTTIEHLIPFLTFLDSLKTA